MNKTQNEMLRELQSYGSEEVITRWNLKRLSYVVALVMLLEIANLFDAGVRSTPYLINTTTLIIVSAAILLPLSICLQRKPEILPFWLARKLYIYFWIFLPTLTAFSFFVRDAAEGRPPLNLLIVIGIISMVPILSTRETVFVFVLPSLANVIIGLCIDGSLTYILYTFVFTLAGTFITVVVHRQYIFLINELNYRMNHDILTGCLSRRSGEERVCQLLGSAGRRGGCFLILMIDIDFFKAYNDSLGHAYGDEVLKKVGEAIRSSFLRESDIVYRYGGEEFCACIELKDMADSSLVVSRLCDNIASLAIPAVNTSADEHLTVSVGGVKVNGKSISFDTAVKLADEALYKAKQEGRNRVCLCEY